MTNRLGMFWKAAFRLVLAAATLTPAVALAQIPGMPSIAVPGGEIPPAIELTEDSIVSFMTSFPAVMEGAVTIAGQYNIPTDDPMSAFGALMSSAAAYGQLNALVTAGGFVDFPAWVQTFTAITLAYAFAQMDAQTAAMMAMYAPTAVPPQVNIDLVNAHREELTLLIEGL